MLKASNEEAKVGEFIQVITAFQQKLTHQQTPADQMQDFLNQITEEQESLQSMYDSLSTQQ